MKKLALILILLIPAITSAEIIRTQINVLGQVNQQGHFNVNDNRVTILDAIAMSGGLSRLADPKQIKLRKMGEDGKVIVEVYDLKKLISGEQKNVTLESGDLIFVEERAI